MKVTFSDKQQVPHLAGVGCVGDTFQILQKSS